MDEQLKKKIIDDFGLSKMPAEEQDKFIEKIGNMLFEAVIERSIDNMDKEAMTDFDEVISNAGEDYQKVITFLSQRVEGFKEIVSEEMARLKKATSGIFA